MNRSDRKILYLEAQRISFVLFARFVVKPGSGLRTRWTEVFAADSQV
jgi:hypothetical protein